MSTLNRILALSNRSSAGNFARTSARQIQRASLSSSASIGQAVGTESEKQLTLVPQFAWLYVDSILPVRLASWDLRHYIGVLREGTLLDRLSTLLNQVKSHDFQVISIEPHPKDGGVFVKFKYSELDGSQGALERILNDLRTTASSHGGVPSWTGMPKGDFWLIKGKPWREDMYHYASPLLKVEFEGPDLRDETLYDILRPYGRIVDITPPTPAPAGTLRSATVGFRSVRAAVRAKNAIHGLAIPSGSSGSPVFTQLRVKYQKPIQAHAVRDYISNHPKIFAPVLIFLLGSLTYIIFDPIRVFMVEGKLNDWFDYSKYSAYQWLRVNMIDRLNATPTQDHTNQLGTTITRPGTWKERSDAEDALRRYLSDTPATMTFLYGPQGSGKSRMISGLTEQHNRKVLVINVAQLSKAGSDAALISGLARQTGYWPAFSFLSSIGNLIDLATIGLIGQKAGFSTSLNDQLKQVLDVVGTGLRAVNTDYVKKRKRKLEHDQNAVLHAEEVERVKERIREGTWHDGRLDCLAGNGVMSELGFGDESLGPADAELVPKASANDAPENGSNGPDDIPGTSTNSEDLQAIEALPIVILKGFESKGSSTRRDELLNALANWAAGLAEGHVAHVIVVSDNRENAKQIARALPSKPLNMIALSDADAGSALTYVKQKLTDLGVDLDFSREEMSYVERLGGRASDLESLAHKIRNGMTVEQAVDDIVSRGVSELRKNAFGDDAEDAKGLAWTREQAWVLMKLLAKKPEVSYYDILADFPFKGDETALREMEHSELIAIQTVNGRPSTIKPGKPVYRYVFEKLVQDTVFQATQDMAVNQKIIASNEATLKACEEELITLNEVQEGTSSWWWGPRKAVSARQEYLLRKMRAAGEKVEALEKQNASLKKLLSRVTTH